MARETAQELVNTALLNNRDHGSISEENLSYLFREENDRCFFSFADDHIISSSVQNQFLTSLLIFTLALSIFYLISRFLAKLALRPAEQAWNQQRQFVADASHELKTPITVILASS